MNSQTEVDSARTNKTENQPLHIPIESDVGLLENRRAQLNVWVKRETRERLQWLAEFLDARTCPVLEALVDAAYLSLERKAESVLLAKDTYVFVDLTVQRLTMKVRKISDGFVRDREILEEDHGNKDQCAFCHNKPIEKVFSYNESKTDKQKCHVTYVCREHLKPELRRLSQLGLTHGHGHI